MYRCHPPATFLIRLYICSVATLHAPIQLKKCVFAVQIYLHTVFPDSGLNTYYKIDMCNSNITKVVILRFDDTKLSRHYDTLGRHQIVIFIKVVSDAAPWCPGGTSIPCHFTNLITTSTNQ